MSGGFWRPVFAILGKDLLTELRSKDIVISVLVFSFLVIVLFNFAFGAGAEGMGVVAAGVLWVAFTFSGMLALNRSFILEKDKGCLEGLLLCPVDRAVIYTGKMLASLLFLLVIEAVVLPVFSLFFALPLFRFPLLLVIPLATLGFVAVGTLFSAIAVNTRAREIMLPILFFPVSVPVLIAAVEVSGLALGGEGWGALGPWLQVILAFDLIFLVVALLAFEYVVEE